MFVGKIYSYETLKAKWQAWPPLAMHFWWSILRSTRCLSKAIAKAQTSWCLMARLRQDLVVERVIHLFSLTLFEKIPLNQLLMNMNYNDEDRGTREYQRRGG